jgi:hypothetical protein
MIATSALNKNQIAALLTDERAIEELEFRDRDDLIAQGLAVRLWPEDGGVGEWRTWLTAAGRELRETIARNRQFRNFQD